MIVNGLQARVGEWMRGCFGPAISEDHIERADRFVEEALELAQSTGWSADRGHALVDYVFGRPIGEPGQEVGGVLVTLAALCNTHRIDMQREFAREVDRITTPDMIERIRAKQAAKPTGSALPIACPSHWRALFDIKIERERQVLVEGWTPKHDDQHADGELAFAASRYAEHASRPDKTRRAREKRSATPLLWPWAERWWKPKDRRRDLVRAAALIVAEIERLDRASAKGAAS